MTLEHAQHPPPLCPGRPQEGAGRRGVLAPPATTGGARISGRNRARIFGTRTVATSTQTDAFDYIENHANATVDDVADEISRLASHHARKFRRRRSHTGLEAVESFSYSRAIDQAASAEAIAKEQYETYDVWIRTMQAVFRKQHPHYSTIIHQFVFDESAAATLPYSQKKRALECLRDFLHGRSSNNPAIRAYLDGTCYGKGKRGMRKFVRDRALWPE